MDFSRITPEGYIFLAASLVVAVVADHAIVRFGLDFAKPASRSAFVLGRVGKLAALVGWLVFFNSYWYPQHLSQDQPLPAWAVPLEWVVVAALALFAFTSYPRPAVAAAARPVKGGSRA